MTLDQKGDTVQDSATHNSLESDIEQLISLSRDIQTSRNSDEVDVDELLRQLDNADGVAKGVEERLDGIIGGLDKLLESLESGGSDGKSTPETTKSSS